MVVPLLLAGCASFRTAASSHPSDQSVTQTIGAKGGRVVFSSGAIDVPPNAFATNTAVRVTLVGESQVKDTLGPGWHPIGPGIRVDLSQQPSSPLTLTVGAGLPVGVDANATFLAAHLSEEAASAALRAPSTDGTGASARSSGPSGTTLPSPSQVVMLPLAAAAGALSASLPGAGWFGAGWLDAQATVERLLPQLRQGFLEFSKLRTPDPRTAPRPSTLRPASCRSTRRRGVEIPTRTYGSASEQCRAMRARWR